MRVLQLGIWLLACFATSGCDGVADLIPSTVGNGDVPAEWGEMLAAVNQFRTEGHTCGGTYHAPVDPLAWNGNLGNAAARHSDDMAEHEHFGHVGTDGSTVGDRVSDTGYEWRAVGENIARNQQSIAEVVNAWGESAGHCENMMNPSYKELGAAMESLYWTQVFGRQR